MNKREKMTQTTEKNGKYAQNDENIAESTHLMKNHVLGRYSTFAAVEAYKAARTNLLFMKKSRGCQHLAITSTLAGEGKTITSINLAISLAENGSRVLLIDADLRRPRVAKTLDLYSENGLTEWLAGIVGESAFNTFITPTAFKNLHVILSGHIPPNPTELLSSTRMHELLEMLNPLFDYVIFDTPPYSLVTDTAVLIPEVDGYIFVVRAGNTTFETLKSAVSRLRQLKAPVMGFILNDFTSKTGSYKYKYKYRSKYGESSYGSGVRYAPTAAGSQDVFDPAVFSGDNKKRKLVHRPRDKDDIFKGTMNSGADNAK